MKLQIVSGKLQIKSHSHVAILDTIIKLTLCKKHNSIKIRNYALTERILFYINYTHSVADGLWNYIKRNHQLQLIIVINEQSKLQFIKNRRAATLFQTETTSYNHLSIAANNFYFAFLIFNYLQQPSGDSTILALLYSSRRFLR